MSEPHDTDEALKSQALDHLRELLEAHWREARDSADEEGRFAIGFKVAVKDGVPVAGVLAPSPDEVLGINDKAQLAATERGAAGVSGAKFGIDGFRSIPVRHSSGHKLAQRLAMRGRPPS